MTTTLLRTIERKPRGLRSLFLGLLGAVTFASLLSSCGKTDSSQGSGETHFLSYCEETCDDGYDCVCGTCTRACDTETACDGTSPASSCVTSPAACGTPARICDVECSVDSECADVDPDARCREGRCRVGTPPADPPPVDPFAVCGSARPPSTCSFEDSCASLDCGGIQYDARGCARAECEGDADCGEGEQCVATSVVNTSVCEPNDSGGCDCGGPNIAIPGAFCNPSDTPPPLGELCDGSDEVRFAFVAEGGFLDDVAIFENPHGLDVLAVDGTCRYFMHSAGYSTRMGTLSPDEAAELSVDIGWKTLPLWDSHVDESCPDAGTQSLLAPGSKASCSCGGCDADAPRGLLPALDAATLRIRATIDSAPEIDGPVRVVALSGDRFGISQVQQPLEWPFAWSVDLLLTDASGSQIRDAGLVIDDPDEAATFRAMRAENDAAALENPSASNAGVILVLNEAGARRALLVRDELPPNIAASLDALRAYP